MQCIEIECYEVTESYDRDIKHVAYFSTKELAEAFKGTSPYLSVSKVKKIYTIFESLEEQKENTKEKIKERALAKLTSQERAVLGF